jgi:hypothetical protein
MAKNPSPMGEALGLSDTLEGIALVVRAHYGEERELIEQPCRTRWALRSPAGNVMKLTYVYTQFDTYYFASIPTNKP